MGDKEEISELANAWFPCRRKQVLHVSCVYVCILIIKSLLKVNLVNGISIFQILCVSCGCNSL